MKMLKMLKNELKNKVIATMIEVSKECNLRNSFKVNTESGRLSFVGKVTDAFRVQGKVINRLVTSCFHKDSDLDSVDLQLAVMFLHEINIENLGTDVLILWPAFFEE